MSELFKALKQGSDFISDSISPVNLDGARPVPDLLSRKLSDIDQIARRGQPVSLDALPAFIDAIKNLNGVGIDDRKFLLEKLLVLMSRLPDDSTFGQKLQKFAIDILYKDLPHPPSGYLAVPTTSSTASIAASSHGVKYAYRSADGSNYNPLFPSLGRAHSPYARSVPSTLITPLSSLPDSGLVFDTLLRRSSFVAHPGGISSLFFAFADLVIHSIFNTNHRDWTQNDVSSYLDLSPLYGSSDEEVDAVRRKDGTGRLWDDVFADGRLLLMPPSVCALLVLLNRNHNYVAEKILAINERGNLKSPPPTEDNARVTQDDEIFHRARLVNTGLFMQIILGDYVGAILGLVRDGLSWRLNPLQTMRELDHEFAPQGEGNVVSLEFNLLYRWHAAISAQDTQWTEAELKKFFNGKEPDQVTIQDFIVASAGVEPPADVRQWVFGDLERDGSGRFKDGEIANILLNATSWAAGAFRARGTPAALRVVEILGIEQARAWGTCSLNEFRKFMGLKPYNTFKEWNPDPEIHTAAEALYHDIENLELHVGLQAEETKEPMPGAGLCPGYTISRAILADAVCLTRGDRFLTVDFTPFNLTSWGYQDCQFQPGDGSYGGMLTKLLFRTLPDYYPAGSTYAHFPFLVPSYMHTKMEQMPESPVAKYTWKRPPAPRPLVVVDSYEGVVGVLTGKAFVSEYASRIAVLTKGVTLDTSVAHSALFASAEVKKWANWFAKTTASLIDSKSINHVGSKSRYVDVVKDVVNLLPVYWIANEIVGLPVKNASNPRGIFREQELYNMFADVCNYVHLNVDPSNDWILRENSVKTAEKVVEYVKGHLGKLTNGRFSVSGISDSVLQMLSGANIHSDDFQKRLLAAGGSKKRTADELATGLFAEVVPTIAHYSQALAHVINFYLDESRSAAFDRIVQLSGARGEAANAELMTYTREALRLDPPVSSLYRTAVEDTSLSGIKVQKGDRVFASVVKANRDPRAFGEDAGGAIYDRPVHEAGIWRVAVNGLLSSEFFEATAPEVLRVIFQLQNLQRGPGKSGQLNRFTQDLHGTPQQSYVNYRGEVTPWPPSLVVQYGA